MSNTSGWLNDVGPGARSRFDYLSGSYIDSQRKKSPGLGVFLNYHHRTHRYCEGCRQNKPRGRAPKVKGWRCDDCKKATT